MVGMESVCAASAYEWTGLLCNGLLLLLACSPFFSAIRSIFPVSF